MRKLDDQEVEAHCSDLATRGYTTIPSCFPIGLMTELRDEIGAIYASGKFNPLRAGPVVTCIQNLGTRYIDLITTESLEKILMGTLNDPYYREIPQERPNYILSEYIARYTTEKLRLHIDTFIPFPGKRTFMAQLGIALDNRGEEEGCTVVVPGTHLSGQYTDRSFTAVTPLPLRAGDVALWDSRLWHGTSAPKSAKPAWLLVATFQMWFIKPRFDATRALPKEIYDRLSASQKAVLGFYSIPPFEPGDQDYRKGYAD